jgi:hypothetical protein
MFMIKVYRTIILSVALYGCKIRSLTVINKHRLRKHDNRVLRNIPGPKRDKVTGEVRRTCNERDSRFALLTCYMGEACGMYERRAAYRVLVGKPEGKRQHGRPRHKQ